MLKKVLSIAGFDGSGGAGLNADLKVCCAFGVYGMSVITLVAPQNTLGVKSVFPMPLHLIKQQLELIFEDIVPDAIKVGALLDVDIVGTVAEFLRTHKGNIPLIVDPVIICKNTNEPRGHKLLKDDAVSLLVSDLLPLADIVTPNLPECETILHCAGKSAIYNKNDDQKNLTGITLDTMEESAFAILDVTGSGSVFLKGGYLTPTQDGLISDFFAEVGSDGCNNGFHLWKHVLDTKNTHGTGCTLSAAIASCMALGFPLKDSIQKANDYLMKALMSAQHQHIGSGCGPLNHFYHLWPTFDRI